MSKNLANIVKICGQQNVKLLKINGEDIEIEFYPKDFVQKPPAPTPVVIEEIQPLVVDKDFVKDQMAEEIDRNYDDLPISDPEHHEDLIVKEMLEEYGELDYAKA